VACPLNCKCEAACHPVPLFCNVPRAQKDALGYANSARDKHCAYHATLAHHFSFFLMICNWIMQFVSAD
jgi:hypothetical protein